jgi:hypothetical protein
VLIQGNSARKRVQIPDILRNVGIFAQKQEMARPDNHIFIPKDGQLASFAQIRRTCYEKAGVEG